MTARRNPEILLDGTVGAQFWDEDYFTAADVRKQLAGMTGDITVRINSGGGIAAEGQAIYAMLRKYSGRVTVVVEGAAASAASLIVMGGDNDEMTEGSWMLIHDPAAQYVTGRGTSAEHARIAAQLDLIGGAYAGIYARRTGLPLDQVRAMMRDETLMVDDEAVAKGFADRVDRGSKAAQAAAFDYRIYAKAPPAAVRSVERLGHPRERAAVIAMIAGVSGQQQESSMNAIITAPQPGVPAAPDQGAHQPKMTAAEMTMLLNTAAAAKVPVDEVTALIEGGKDYQQARDAIIAKWADQVDDRPRPGLPRSQMGRDFNAPHELVARQSDALAAKLAARLGVKHEPTIGRSHMDDTLADMKAAQMAAHGFNLPRGADPFTMAAHTRDDFPLVVGGGLEAVTGRMMEDAPVAIERAAREIEAVDYRPGNSVMLTGSGVPEKVNENGEVKFTTINETGEAKAVPDDFASIFRVSNKALVNDGTALSLLADVGRLMVKGAMELRRQTLIAPLVANAGAGQTMRDGNPLFHATHGNLAASNAAITVTSLSVARTAMRRQKDSKGNQLNIAPRFLIVPPELETVAQKVVAEITAATVDDVNPFAGRLDVLVEPGLASATGWYLAADPQLVDGLAVAYLSGQRTPQIASREGWDRLGLEFRLVWAIGAAFHGYQGWYRNPGA